MAREAKQSLEAMPESTPAELAAQILTGSDGTIGTRMHVALERVARERAWGRRTGTAEARETFLAAIRAGIAVDWAADLAGTATSTMYDHRHRDPEFAKAWEDALDASVGPLERSLEDVAFNAPIDSMARVNAAKALLSARSSRHNPKPAPPNMSATMQAPNGSAVTFRVGGSLPD